MNVAALRTAFNVYYIFLAASTFFFLLVSTSVPAGNVLRLEVNRFTLAYISATLDVRFTEQAPCKGDKAYTLTFQNSLSVTSALSATRKRRVPPPRLDCQSATANHQLF